MIAASPGNLHHRLFLVPGWAARGSAYFRKFACGRGSGLDTVQGGRHARQFETSERDDILDRLSAGRETCQRPDGRSEQRKAPAPRAAGPADPVLGGEGESRGSATRVNGAPQPGVPCHQCGLKAGGAICTIGPSLVFSVG
jgi:hypothetical protein